MFSGEDMKYIHYILTRFNVDLYNKNYIKWKKDKNGIDIDPEIWLENRFKLFETYCLPSIINQTTKNFKWIVVYDPDTPKKWLSKIEQYKNICSNYIPVFNSPQPWGFGINWINFISHKEYSHIVTTRLDNDDCLSNNAIEQIQDNIIDKDLLFINILNGYRYDVINKNFYELTVRSNAFITVVEKTEKFKMIFRWGNHDELQYTQEKNIKNIENGHWLQVIHDHNLKNEIRGKNIETKIPQGFFFSKYSSMDEFLDKYNLTSNKYRP